MDKSEILKSEKTLQKNQVTVNFRNLIDKLLGRYKGGVSSVFRELLMNADDAGASAARVMIDEDQQRLMIGNNSSFSSEDWTRLQSIADGNPNENSIGCFGVGFYSVFSICDEPIVRSGETSMIFVWSGNMLDTISSQVPTKEDVLPTEIILSYAQQGKEFQVDVELWTATLESLLLFTKNVQEITLQRVGHSPIVISKKLALKDECTKFSRDELVKSQFFALTNLKRLDLDVQTRRGKETTTAHFLQVTGQFTVTPTEQLTRKILSIFKKEPPRTVTAALVFGGEGSSCSPVTQPGRVFIGAQTHQTTGSSFHACTAFLPTVEREDIDFNLSWNVELAVAVGLLLRVFYNRGIASASREDRLFVFNSLALAPSTPASELGANIVTGFFAQHSPLMLPLSGNKLGSAANMFLPAHELETLIPTASRLHTAVLPLKDLSDERERVFGKEHRFELLEHLISRGALKPLTFAIIVDTLKRHQASLTPEDVLRAFRWLHSKWQAVPKKASKKNATTKPGPTSPEALFDEMNRYRKLFFAALGYDALAYYGEKEIKFLSPSKLCLPYSYTKEFGSKTLESLPFSLEKVPIKPWAQWLKQDLELIENNPKACISCLDHLAGKIGTLPAKEKTGLIKALQTRNIIPVDTQGRCVQPAEAYLKAPNEVVVSSHLDYVVSKLADRAQTLLQDLGVKMSAPVDLILERLSSLKVGTEELLALLVKQKLAPNDWQYLRSTAFLPSTEAERDQPEGLYLPSELVQTLGLPMLKIDFVLSEDKMSFLKKIGVLEHPTMKSLLEVCCDLKHPHRRAALDYFLDNFDQYKKEYKAQQKKVKFLLAEDPAGNKRLASPSDIFTSKLNVVLEAGPATAEPAKKKGRKAPAKAPATRGKRGKAASTRGRSTKTRKVENEEEIEIVDEETNEVNNNNANNNNNEKSEKKTEVATHFIDWLTLAEDLHEVEPKKLGVLDRPPPEVLIDKLSLNPPPSNQLAALVNFCGLFNDNMQPKHWTVLRKLAFVRTPSDRLVTVGEVFEGTEVNVSKYGPLFEWIDLSETTPEGREFLRQCGWASSPSTRHVCEALLRNGHKLLEEVGVVGYLRVLNVVATNVDQLEPADLKPFLQGPVFPGLVPTESSSADEKLECDLFKAAEVYLVDNTDMQKAFQPVSSPVLTLEIEALYQQAGAKWLSSAVKESTEEKGEKIQTSKTREWERTIQERQKLFVTDTNTCQPREGLKRNANSLLKGLEIRQCEKIIKHMSLGKTKHSTTTASSVARSTICVEPNCKTFALAKALVVLLMNKFDQKLVSEYHTFLTESRESMREAYSSIDRLFTEETVWKSPLVNKTKKAETSDIFDSFSGLSGPSEDDLDMVKINNLLNNKNNQQHNVNNINNNGTGGGLPSKTNLIKSGANMFEKVDLACGLTGAKVTSIDEALSSQRSLSKAIQANPSNPNYQFGVTAEEFEEMSDKDYYNNTQLIHVGNGALGIRLLEVEGSHVWNRCSEHLRESVEAFESLLLDLAPLFKAKKNFSKVIAIFVDPSTVTLAFNYGTLIHFNLAYFDQFFFRTNKTRATALAHYYGIWCHELAHNLVSDHNVLHGNAMEAAFIQFIDPFIDLYNENKDLVFDCATPSFKFSQIAPSSASISSASTSSKTTSSRPTSRKTKKTSARATTSGRTARSTRATKSTSTQADKENSGNNLVDLTDD